MYTCRPLQAHRSVSSTAEKKYVLFYERSQQYIFQTFCKKVSVTIRYEAGCSFNRTTEFWLWGQTFHPLSDPYRAHIKIVRSVYTYETIKRITERTFNDSKVMLGISRLFKNGQK